MHNTIALSYLGNILHSRGLSGVRKRQYKKRKWNISRKRQCTSQSNILDVKVHNYLYWRSCQFYLCSWRCHEMVNYISLQFSRIKFGKQDKSELGKNKIELTVKSPEPSYRLNRIYVLYLRPVRSKKNKRGYDTNSGNKSTKIYSRGNCHNSNKKMKSFVLPDPWTSRTRRLAKQMLCKGCRE